MTTALFIVESPSAQGQPVVPKIVRRVLAAFSCMNHHEPFFVRLSLPTPTIIYYTGGPVLIVIMCYTLSTIIIIGGKILLITVSRKASMREMNFKLP